MPTAAFLSADVKSLLRNKFVVIIGDSIQRGVYKDLVQLLQTDCVLSAACLKKKGELSFLNDELIEGGRMGQMHNGTAYKEVRQYQTDYYLIRFYFVTRCYNEYMETILEDFMNEDEPKPDVVLMNSCVWDITRYGPNAMPMYHKNLIQLFNRFDEVIPDNTLVVWSTCLPVDKKVRGGFMVPEVDFLNTTLRGDILEGNFFARQVAAEHGYDVLDLHYYFKNMTHHRVKDGIHWNQTAHRRMSNLILTHIAEAWGFSLPARVQQLIEPISQTYENQRINRNNNYHDYGNTPYRYVAPDYESRYGGPVNRPSYMDPPQRNHHRSVSYDPQSVTCVPLLKPRTQNNVMFLMQQATKTLQDYNEANLGQYQEDCFQVPAVPQRRFHPYNRNNHFMPMRDDDLQSPNYAMQLVRSFSQRSHYNF